MAHLHVIARLDNTLNTASFEEMLRQWRAVGSTMSDLIGRRFEPHTSRSRDQRVTDPPSRRFVSDIWIASLS